MKPPPDTVIFADRPDWHVRGLTTAFADYGVAARVVSLSDCALEVGEEGPVFHLPQRMRCPPALAFVKGIAAGSFEQVTLRLGLLHGLAASGCRVVNAAPAIERAVDKSQTSLLLARAGIPTPPAWTVQSREAAAALVRREASAGHELVLKPLFGAQGRGLLRLTDPLSVPEADAIAGVYYLQRFVPPAEGRGYGDCRVLVSAGRALAAMRREHDRWITNVHQGAICRPLAAAGRIAELASAAAAVVEADYAGIDLIEDGNGGWQVLEVNSMPAWKGLQSVTPFAIAPLLVRDALALVTGAEGDHGRAA